MNIRDLPYRIIGLPFFMILGLPFMIAHYAKLCGGKMDARFFENKLTEKQ